jgi:hypothetical protein
LCCEFENVKTPNTEQRTPNKEQRTPNKEQQTTNKQKMPEVFRTLGFVFFFYANECKQQANLQIF